MVSRRNALLTSILQALKAAKGFPIEESDFLPQSISCPWIKRVQSSLRPNPNVTVSIRSLVRLSISSTSQRQFPQALPARCSPNDEIRDRKPVRPWPDFSSGGKRSRTFNGSLFDNAPRGPQAAELPIRIEPMRRQLASNYHIFVSSTIIQIRSTYVQEMK